MDEVTVILTSMTSLGVDDGVRNHLWSIVAKPSESVPELGSDLVSSNIPS